MIPFTKMHGIGNDYVYVDAAAHPVDEPHALAVRMSDRHRGVGADGLILVLPPEGGAGADVRMRMFNADGSESEMCGNGIRCLCKFVRERGISDARPMRVQTGAGVLELSYGLDAAGRVDRVTVDMGAPILEPESIPVRPPDPAQTGPLVDVPIDDLLALPGPPGWAERCGLDPRLTCLSMGNPHLVLFCERIDDLPLAEIGTALETHEVFPSRINVHVVRVNRRDDVSMRTWERGSGITMACGTGASAVCVAGALSRRTDRAITAHLPGGDLQLEWDDSTGHVLMTGPAVEVFRGEWVEQT